MTRRILFVVVLGTAALAAACGSKTSGGPAVCGNGDQQPGEECDGNDLAGADCASLGLEGGTLSCEASCTFDVTQCTGAATCGDDIRQYPEACDGADLAGAACTDFGFTGGDLACNSNCSLDTSGCTGVPPCGDGLVAPAEECDGANLSGQTCASLGLGTGDLDCDSQCHFDVSDCSSSPTCGDDVAEGTEACDGSDLGGETCLSQGWHGGELSCSSTCTLDDSGCWVNALCGNDVLDTGEACDGSDLDGEDCASQGFAGGTLTCSGACTFDTGGCLAEICGNDIQEGSEACDGTDFDGVTCETLGHDGGFLTCTNTCAIDESACEDCTTSDATPPAAANHLPAPETQGYSGTGTISLDLSDGCGVDTSTLVMTLSIARPTGPIELRTVTPLITGSGTNVSLAFTPTNPNHMPAGAIITVEITVDDINGNTLVETWRYSVVATITLWSGGTGGMSRMNELDESQPTTVIAGMPTSFKVGGASPAEHRVIIRFNPAIPAGALLMDATLSLGRCPGMAVVGNVTIDCHGMRIDSQAHKSTWLEQYQGPPGPSVAWSVPGADGVPADRSGTLGASVQLLGSVGDFVWQSGSAMPLLTEWYAGDGNASQGIVCRKAANTTTEVCAPGGNATPKIDVTYGPALP